MDSKLKIKLTCVPGLMVVSLYMDQYPAEFNVFRNLCIFVPMYRIGGTHN